MTTRREIVTKCGAGLAAIIAAGKAPAALVRSMLGMRNAMMAGGEGWQNPYVTDGLVAMWDGIENAGWGVHDPNATVWKDIIADYDMNVADLSNMPTWGDNFCNLIGQSYFVCVRSIPDVTTAEVLYTMDVDKTRGELLYLRNALIQFAIYGNKFIVSLVYSKNMPTKKTGTHCVALVKDSADWTTYLDGIVNITGTRDFYAARQTGDYIGAGAYGVSSLSGENKYTQKINCIRLYSRALTADEIAANYAVDKARFNLPDAT